MTACDLTAEGAEHERRLCGDAVPVRGQSFHSTSIHRLGGLQRISCELHHPSTNLSSISSYYLSWYSQDVCALGIQ